MRVAIVNGNQTQAKQVREKLIQFCNAEGIELDNESPNLVISVGGDGTLLHAFHRFSHRLNKLRFVGIHTGHLGFYTDWVVEELDAFLMAMREDLVTKAHESVSYPLLEVTITKKDGSFSRHLALNESAIRRYEGTMTTEVYINDELFELFKGDGLCVSTPTGSTGLNKSLGGAVIHPYLDAIQLAEIASINNRVYRTLSSPLLIPANERIILHPKEDTLSGISLSIDHEIYAATDIKQITYRVSEDRVHFARYRHTHFWNRVKNSFIGNVRPS